mgnify:CR=1 FL=1
MPNILFYGLTEFLIRKKLRQSRYLLQAQQLILVHTQVPAYPRIRHARPRKFPDKPCHKLDLMHSTGTVMTDSGRHTVGKFLVNHDHGKQPVVVIDKELSNRMASTIRHNRARGTHNIELMCNIVAELDHAGMSDQWIMKNIGMDRDELLRLKQISGLADLFANKDFSIPDNKPEYIP